MESLAGLALAFSGKAVHEQARTERLADDLARRFPEDTVVRFNYLPSIRGLLALSRNDPSKAFETLQASNPYELGLPPSQAFSHALYPVYVRGQAYLAAHQGSEAATEFQKILDHRGVVFNEPIGALAHLGLAGAYALQAGTDVGAGLAPPRAPQGTPLQPDAHAKARAKYQEFLALWKDADRDIPILKQAQAEYAKLQ